LFRRNGGRLGSEQDLREKPDQFRNSRPGHGGDCDKGQLPPRTHRLEPDELFGVGEDVGLGCDDHLAALAQFFVESDQFPENRLEVRKVIALRLGNVD